METKTKSPVDLGILAAAISALLGWIPWSDRIPSRECLMAWILEVLANGEPHSLDEIHRHLAMRSDFTEEQLREFLPERDREKWNRQVERSLDELHGYGLAYLMGPGFYKPTKMGLTVAAQQPGRINLAYLRRFEEFLHWEYRRKYGYFPQKGNEPPPPEPAPSVPGRLGLMADRAPEDPELLKDPRIVRLWFGTDRIPKDSKRPQMGYSNERGSTTHYGRCVVNIPEGHKTAVTERGGLLAKWEIGTLGIVVKTIEGMSEDDFLQKAGTSFSASVDDDSVLFFLHGYNVSFQDAAIRTAQLKYDLKIPHAAFYSWSSRATEAGYAADAASVDAAAPRIADFLTRLGALTAQRQMKLHVIAHSMGNLGILLALDRILLNLKGGAPNLKLTSVVFAAPDVDQEKFLDCVPRSALLSGQRTLYASKKDIPLKLSGALRSAPRAGKIPPVTIVQGTDTVDVSEIDLSKLGHGYVAENRPVLTDIAAMQVGLPPVKRVGLNQSADGKYWVLT